MSAYPDSEATERDLSWQRWVQSRRQRKLLALAQCAACLAAGMIIGRAYSVATAPPPPSTWWTIKAQPGGFVAGPFEMLDTDGHSLLKVSAGQFFAQTDGPITLACVDTGCEERSEIRRLMLQGSQHLKVIQ